MKQYVTRINLMLLAILLVLPSSSFQSNDLIYAEDAQQGVTEEVEEIPLSAITATKEVLSNDFFKLYIDEETANVRIVSKQDHTEWLGAPQVPTTLPPNNLLFVNSPLHLRYTEGSDITTTYSLKDKTTEMVIHKVNDVIKVSYNFSAEGIALDLIYSLTERGLHVEIPFESIKETGKAKLTSLEVLPFFNAALETDKGAMFIPDGSGALLHYRTNHEQYLQGYSEYIYGNDAAFVSHNHDMLSLGGNRGNTQRESITLPVFGNYKNDIGFLAIVGDGQFEAKVNANPAGIRAIPIYRNAVEFMYRKSDIIFIGNSGQITYFQGQLIEGNRSVEYVLLKDEQASYVGLAKAYRDYLINVQGVTPTNNQEPLLSLNLFGGILREEIIGDTFIEMTTFEQAKSIIEQLQLNGVSNMTIIYEGWTKDGIYGSQPQHKVARQLGGKKKLEQLISFANQKNVPIYLKANYVKPFQDTGKYSTRKDSIRSIDREILKATLFWPSDRWSKDFYSFNYLKPEVTYKKYISKQYDTFIDLGVTGVHLDYMGEQLYSDEDVDYLTNRSVTAKVWQDSLVLMKNEVGSASVDYGHAYTLGLVDRIDNVPLSYSGYTYTDEAIPFYQLVIHGLVPYYASAINLREDSIVEKLKMIEYGAGLSATLTAEPSSHLHRTAATYLYSSHAEDWVDTIADEYKLLYPLYEAIAGEQMVDHEKIQPNVYKTTYSNGVFVVVNYTNSVKNVSGLTIEAMNFAWGKE